MMNLGTIGMLKLKLGRGFKKQQPFMKELMPNMNLVKPHKTRQNTLEMLRFVRWEARMGPTEIITMSAIVASGYVCGRLLRNGGWEIRSERPFDEEERMLETLKQIRIEEAKKESQRPDSQQTSSPFSTYRS